MIYKRGSEDHESFCMLEDKTTEKLSIDESVTINDNFFSR